MRDRRYPDRVRFPRLGLLLVLLVVLAGCDTALLPSSNGGTASPAGSVESATAPARASEPVAAPSDAGGGGTGSTTGPVASEEPPAAPLPATMSLAVVTGFTNYKTNALTSKQLVAELKAGDVLVPCGTEAAIAEALGSTRTGWAKCVQVGSIAGKPRFGLGRLRLDPARLRVAAREGRPARRR